MIELAPTSTQTWNSTKKKLQVMMDIQEKLNNRVNPSWKSADYNWRDAIMVETVELFDHLPWKWWKANPSATDWGQVNMEAVDIWHFLLSELLQEKDNVILNYIVSDLSDGGIYTSPDINHVKENLKVLLSFTLTPLVSVGVINNSDREENGSTASLFEMFKGLIDSMSLSFDDLYKLYVGKAQLNEFRWANGYGTRYIKDWLGQEDNQYLTEVIQTLDVNDKEFANKITGLLSARYAEVLAAQAVTKNAEVEEYKERITEIL